MATATTFIERREKAAWGIACNQRADGSLWVGKGYECGLEEQLGASIETAVLIALEKGRGSRNGRFWVNLKKKTVTMYVDAPHENRVRTVPF